MKNLKPVTLNKKLEKKLESHPIPLRKSSDTYLKENVTKSRKYFPANGKKVVI